MPYLCIINILLVLAGAIIRDGDRNEMPFGLTGLSPCVVPKNLFLEKIAPYTRDPHACKWSGSRVEKLKFFSTCSKWRPNLKIPAENQSARWTHLRTKLSKRKGKVERRQESWNESILIT